VNIEQALLADPRGESGQSPIEILYIIIIIIIFICSDKNT